MKRKLRLKPEIKEKAKKFFMDLPMGFAIACIGIILIEMIAWRYQTLDNKEINYYEELRQKKTEMSRTQISQK